MNLLIDGERRAFVPLKQFRAEQHLPPDFSVALFEPKDFAGLGRIDQAGAALNDVRAATLAACDALSPPQPPPVWLAALPRLQAHFTDQLNHINADIGLRPVEIEFAAAGFRDVCEAVIFARVRAGDAVPTFGGIYADWLDSTTRVSQTLHPYTHDGHTWGVQIVTHAYGRAGLIVHTGEAIHYVADDALGCPAEGFMLHLLAAMAERLLLTS
jgi:hypothetical protein